MTKGAWLTAWFVTVVVGAAPAGALAHTGDGAPGAFAAGVAHPIAGLDHVLAMVAVGLWAAQLGGRARWIVPAVFVGGMLLAGAAGMAGMPMPIVEAGIIASVLVLGVLITAAVRLPLPVSAVVVALFALLHGHAHGAEVPVVPGSLAYGAGFALATALLHACGVAVGGVVTGLGVARLARVAGGAIAVAGVYLTLV